MSLLSLLENLLDSHLHPPTIDTLLNIEPQVQWRRGKNPDTVLAVAKDCRLTQYTCCNMRVASKNCTFDCSSIIPTYPRAGVIPSYICFGLFFASLIFATKIPGLSSRLAKIVPKVAKVISCEETSLVPPHTPIARQVFNWPISIFIFKLPPPPQLYSF